MFLVKSCIHKGVAVVIKVSVYFLSQHPHVSWPTQRTYTGHELNREQIPMDSLPEMLTRFVPRQYLFNHLVPESIHHGSSGSEPSPNEWINLTPGSGADSKANPSDLAVVHNVSNFFEEPLPPPPQCLYRGTSLIRKRPNPRTLRRAHA